jgi:hypothetical protein
MRLFFVALITLLFLFSVTSCVTSAKATPTKIVVVKNLPRTHKVVSVKGKNYYKWNEKHYRKTNSGYMVVRL